MQEQLAKIWNNEFFKGGVVLTLSSLVVNVFNYFFNFLAGRALGPSGYGEISTLFSYITILTIPMAVVTMVIIQKIGATDKEKTTYAKSIELYVIAKLRRYSPFFLLLLLLMPFIPQITNLSLLSSYVLLPLILLAVLTSIYTSLLQGLKLFFLISIVSLVITFLKLLGSIAAILNLGEIEVVILFLCISSLVGYVASQVAFRSHAKIPNKSIDNAVFEKRLFHIFTSPQFIITGLSVAAVTALNNIDVIFVKKFFTANEAGLYSSWSLFAKAIFYVLGPLLAISFTFFTHTKNQEDQDKSFFISVGALTIFGIVSYVFYTFFSEFIINVLFGSRFAGIIPYLGLASIYGSLYAMITFVNNYFLAKKSYFALVLAFTLPIYVLFLFLLPKNMSTIFLLNICYSLVVVILYFLAFLREKIRYNTTNGK